MSSAAVLLVSQGARAFEDPQAPGTSHNSEPETRKETPLEKAEDSPAPVETSTEPIPVHLKPLEWKDEWARAGKANYALIGAGTALSVGFAILKPLGHHNLTNDILIDKGGRNALRIDSLNGRFTARDVSDVLLSLETTWPFFIDSLVVAGGARKSPEVAWEMAVIDAEVIVLTTMVQQITTWAVSRPRPYIGECRDGSLPDGLNDCVRNGRYRSFFSGHSATAFAGASLICAHRARLELFGGGADVATCVTAYVAAAATATLRVAGDMHNVSDVVTGAIIGTAIGLGIPALHYRHHDRAKSTRQADFDLSVYPTGTGFGLAVMY